MVRRPFLLRGCIGRIARRLPFRRSLRSHRPKAPRASRFAPPRSPEGDPNLAPVHQFDPKIHQAFRFGRRGRARSSEESQHSQPPAASQGLDAEASPPCVAASAPSGFAVLTGVPSGFPLQLTTALSEDASIVCGPSVCRARPARFRAPDRTWRGPMSQPRKHRLRLAARLTFSKIKPLNNLPISRSTVLVSMSSSCHRIRFVPSVIQRVFPVDNVDIVHSRVRSLGTHPAIESLFYATLRYRGRYAPGIDSKQREFRHA